MDKSDQFDVLRSTAYKERLEPFTIFMDNTTTVYRKDGTPFIARLHTDVAGSDICIISGVRPRVEIAFNPSEFVLIKEHQDDPTRYKLVMTKAELIVLSATLTNQMAREIHSKLDKEVMSFLYNRVSKL